MRYAATIAIAAAVCLRSGAQCRIRPGVVDTRTAKELCATAPRHDVAGLWQIAGSHTVLLIVRNNAGAEAALPEYDVVMVQPEDSERRTGEIAGTLRPAAKGNAYELRFGSSRPIIVEHNETEGTLTWGGTDRKNTRIRVNVFGLVPMLNRLLGVYIDPRRDSLKGLRKVYPAAGASAKDIIML